MSLISSIVGLAEILLLLCTSVISEGSNQSQSDLAPRITDFKLNLHRFLEGTRIRKKRRAQEFYGPPEHQMRVGSSSPENLPYLSDYSLTFWISVEHQSSHQVLVGTEEGHLILFELSEADDKIARVIALSMHEDVSSKATAFSHLDEQWFAILQSSANKTWIRFYLRVGRGLERRQIIALDGETDFNLVTVKGLHYLAVTKFRSSIHQAGLLLYHWTKTQFDIIASRTVYGARSVATWVMDGSLYFAVAQELNEEGGFSVASPIFLFNAKDNSKLVFLETIASYGPTKVLHFYVSGSHYVIFIGKQDAAIYWWASNQFLFWQSIEGTAHASDVAVLALANGEVVIVIALKEEALFLTLDATGHYYVSFTMLLSGFNLKSLQFMYSGKAYYALALSVTSLSHRPQPVWKLTLDPYTMPTGSSLEPLHQCLNDLTTLLDEHQSGMNSVYADLGRVWLKDKKQTITADVIVTNEMTAPQPSIITEILIVTSHKILPDSSLHQVVEGVSRLKAVVGAIQQNIKSSVLRSARQEIKGNKHFRDSIFIPSMNMDSTNVDIAINGISLSRIDRYALRKVGNQTFDYPAIIGNIHSESIATGSLNGILIDDILLLKGDQEISGVLKFTNTQATEMVVGNINTISVDNFVTTHSNQLLRDLKHMASLQARVIGVQEQTNGEDLEDFGRKIITKDDENEMTKRCYIESTVHIYGDVLLTGLMNDKFNIPQLALETVTKYTEQNLRGHFQFISPLHVLGDLAIAGHVNDVDINTLVTLLTDQSIHADVVFYELLTFNRDLVVDLVNGFDLDKTALLKTVDSQFVLGFKIFTERMVVDFLDMTEYVTLDGVDPSLLVQDIVKHKEGVVTNNDTIFHNVVVLGNVTAVEGVNGHKVFDLPETVWLKSVSQVVEVPVNILKVSFKELEVTMINNYHLEDDVVLSYNDETIISIKTFANNVSVVNNVNTVIGAKLNGFDVISFKEEMDKYEVEGTIRGKKFLQRLEIHGDIDAVSLNGLPLNDIMRPQIYQEVTAQVEFPSELTLVKDDLKATDVLFHKFNSNNLHDLLGTAPEVSPKRTFKNKAFSNLKAQNLILHNGGHLNRIKLSEMLERVVTLNTPQHIVVEKTFLTPVHLQRTSSAVSVNGKDLPSFVNNVVLKDQVSSIISPKIFVGNVVTDNIFIHGLVNEINFAHLSQNVFYKSLENHVKPRMDFRGGLTVGRLVSGFIDGMKWDDLILITENEALDHVQLLSNTVLRGHLAVGGLLNECDLTQLGQRALYAKKTDQLITEEVTIQSIEILGNLNMRNIVNEISMEELQRNFITVSGDQVIASDVKLGHGFEVESLHLTDLTNHVGIPFIISDTVKHSIPQEIGGDKHFHDLRTTVLTARESFVIESLDGVEVNDIYSNAVWKHGHQVIEGEKIFHSLNAGVATIEGYINGLMLPQDVVMANTTEHITRPTFIISESVLGSDIIVDGRLDGVHVPGLIESRITLTGEDLVTSQLSFLRDTILYGELTVDGTVNELVLEVVCRRNQQFPLDGYKVFIQNIHVLGSLSASSVNGYDVQRLDQSILRYNEEEFVNELQVFEKPLKVQNSLFTGWINNVSIPHMVSTYSSIINNFYRTVNYFDDLAFGFHKQVTRQIQDTGNKVSKFAYFILVQEINVGPTTKILHGYRLEHSSSEFSHSMVLWTLHKYCTYVERCCHMEFAHWMRVKRTGQLVIDSGAEPGRFYPIHNPGPVTIDRDFVIWTNTTDTQPKWCSNSYDETMFLTGSGHSEIFMNIRNAPLLSEVKSFRQGHLYAVAGFFYDSRDDEYSSAVVYVFNEIKRKWSEHQILPSFGVLSLDITEYNNEAVPELLLAIGTGTGTYSSVYKWNDLEYEFELLRNIPSAYVTSTLWVKQGSAQLLAMASVDHWPKKGGDCLEFLSGGQINIYIYEKGIKWIQSIPLRGVVSMITFNSEGNTFLVAASHQLQTIYIYEWKGYAGFSQIQSMFVGEVKHLNTYMIRDDRYMTVAITSGPSKVLKVVLQGRHAVTATVKQDESSQDDQKDEASIEDKFKKSDC